MSTTADVSQRLVLVLNAGSSSLKAGLFGLAGTSMPELMPLLRLAVSSLATTPHLTVHDGAGVKLEDRPAEEVAAGSYESALAAMLARAEAVGYAVQAIAAVGHRVVHGGSQFSAPSRITPDVICDLERLAPLAPHHQPANVAGIRAIATRMPGVAQVAVFDTAFHASQPELATRLPLPDSYWQRGFRRYGFHGISYQYLVDSFARATGQPLPRRLIAAHLGNGASMCAIADGRSVATTMGFSTLDGLVMGTRCGAIDPGVLIALMREDRLDADALERLLYDRSGLLGLSGLSADMRTLLGSREPAAADAIRAYCYWAARHAGSLMAAIGGCDAMVFTGGIGENAPPIRAGILAHLAWTGAVLDADANARGEPSLAAANSTIGIWVFPADEERAIARETARLLLGVSD